MLMELFMLTGKATYIITCGIQTVYKNMFTFSFFKKLAKKDSSVIKEYMK